MTLLVGAAALLAVGAGVTLFLGWSTDDPALVWTSLIASGFAALLLVAAARSSPPGDD
jgi:hypothetical protein